MVASWRSGTAEFTANGVEAAIAEGLGYSLRVVHYPGRLPPQLIQGLSGRLASVGRLLVRGRSRDRAQSGV